MATICTHILFLSLAFSLFLVTSAVSEAEILLQFKNSIDDPLNVLSGWSNTSAVHHCNWTGVSCTDAPSNLISSLNLQSLNLSGEISASICNLARLSHLNLADNFFNQPIPLHLSECEYLVTLNISNNLIWGTIPEQIAQFKKLEVLDFSRNHIEGKIPENIGLLQRLKVLNLGSNLLSGIVPLVFGNFSELVVLDLSHNTFLVSQIPVDIGQLSELEQLLLQSSGFYGEIPDFFSGLKRLMFLDFSQNNLTGTLPQIDLFLPNLVSFDVSQNKLSGPFPAGVCVAKGVVSLSLHTNFFNGSIPNNLISECVNLERFEVQNNGFSGDFPSGLWSLRKIKLIRAENNMFTGEIPDLISECAQLEHVQIDNNSFTSRFPQGIGKVGSLYRFSASLNHLYGDLPPNFCDSPVMSIINLSHNSLSGKIPEVRKCRKLVSFSLASNTFVGEIPESLADLPVLTYLDLSQNNLTGAIPPQLEKLKLALFNVSFNQLSGRVPEPLISGLPASYLEGNPRLCGPGLPQACLNDEPMHKPSSFVTLACAIVFISLAFTLLVIAFGLYLVRCHKQTSQLGMWRSVFFYPLRVTEHDLLISMDEKTARGGGGGFGRVYVVNLPSSEVVVVKKILNFASQSTKVLKNEVKTLAKIRHKNIVKILGFCHSDDSIFLIYEYLPMGSLADLLGKPDNGLSWSVRLNIAIGIAQGLAYLHKDYVPHLLHRNVKSSNVLLDVDFQPKLTHFALDRIVGENIFQSVITSESCSSCYLAPEYGHTKKGSEQIDTYGFGVVLLELVTGRQAEEEREPGEGEGTTVDVVKWVRRKINITNGAVKLLDPKISSSSQHVQQQMLEALEIGLRCTSVVPEKRPSMGEVVKALEKSRFQGMEVSADTGGSSVPV